MRNFLDKIKVRWKLMMNGRYGYDELSHFLNLAGMLMLCLSVFPSLRIFYPLAFAVLIWSMVRSFSRNTEKRQSEKETYLTYKTRVVQKCKRIGNRWRYRKTHRYYKCPHCKTVLRVTKPPKGKTMTITCPKCHETFEKKT